MLWRLRSSAPWHDLPERYGSWQTVYDRFTRYCKDGKLDRILQTLQRCLDAGGLLDWDLWRVDGTVVRASRAAAGAGHKGDLPSRPIMPWAAHVAVSPASSIS
jgi:transposase